MFRRPHHRQVARVLEAMNADFLRQAKCYFGGGTAIALLSSDPGYFDVCVSKLGIAEGRADQLRRALVQKTG